MPINHQPVWLIPARAIRIGSRALAVTPSFELITAAWGGNELSKDWQLQARATCILCQ